MENTWNMILTVNIVKLLVHLLYNNSGIAICICFNWPIVDKTCGDFAVHGGITEVQTAIITKRYALRVIIVTTMVTEAWNVGQGWYWYVLLCHKPSPCPVPCNVNEVWWSLDDVTVRYCTLNVNKMELQTDRQMDYPNSTCPRTKNMQTIMWCQQILPRCTVGFSSLNETLLELTNSSKLKFINYYSNFYRATAYCGVLSIYSHLKYKAICNFCHAPVVICGLWYQ